MRLIRMARRLAPLRSRFDSGRAISGESPNAFIERAGGAEPGDAAVCERDITRNTPGAAGLRSPASGSIPDRVNCTPDLLGFSPMTRRANLTRCVAG